MSKVNKTKVRQIISVLNMVLPEFKKKPVDGICFTAFDLEEQKKITEKELYIFIDFINKTLDSWGCVASWLRKRTGDNTIYNYNEKGLNQEMIQYRIRWMKKMLQDLHAMLKEK